ncbi:hypothetical protein GTS_16340 [Gandjariella thermophila]|uniref:Uncharacterized protein n=1 Tax=Gandjariella thermophila TaxID=1931992 RepID=A0A4D4J0L6_9PSEU|nr:hypothetical protein GTS_16340 [Gandjariella thermophila]
MVSRGAPAMRSRRGFEDDTVAVSTFLAQTVVNGAILAGNPMPGRLPHGPGARICDERGARWPGSPRPPV